MSAEQLGASPGGIFGPRADWWKSDHPVPSLDRNNTSMGSAGHVPRNYALTGPAKTRADDGAVRRDSHAVPSPCFPEFQNINLVGGMPSA
jgi:hypothetical protein